MEGTADGCQAEGKGTADGCGPEAGKGQEAEKNGHTGDQGQV